MREEVKTITNNSYNNTYYFSILIICVLVFCYVGSIFSLDLVLVHYYKDLRYALILGLDYKT